MDNFDAAFGTAFGYVLGAGLAVVAVIFIAALWGLFDHMEEK